MEDVAFAELQREHAGLLTYRCRHHFAAGRTPATLGHGSHSQTDTLAQVGSAKIEATHSKAVPQWLGIGGIVIGGLLLVGGIASKRR